MIEVLVALMVIVVGAISALRLLTLGAVANDIAKQRVVATNLAREGIEAVRNVRDTNWLRFSGERRKCWNNENTSTCDGSDLIDHGVPYIVKQDSTTYKWTLDDITTGDLDLADGDVSADDKNFELYLKDDFYQHDNSGDDSPFFREIKMEYLKEDQSSNNDDSLNIMRVNSRVEWINRGKPYNTTLTTILTDYLGRSDHS